MPRAPSQQSQILSKLDRLEELVTQARIDIAGLKVRAGAWGAIAGMATAVLGWLLTR